MRRTSVVALLVLFVGCTPPAPVATNGPSVPEQVARASGSPTPIEANDAGARTACAARVLTEFVHAFNSADASTLGRIVGPGPLGAQGFQWVSMSTSSEFGPTLRGPGVNEVDYTAEGARRLLLRHSEQGERWRLVSARAGEGPSWHGGVDAEVHFERTLGNGSIVRTGGKTALSCVGSAIYVLSLGDE